MTDRQTQAVAEIIAKQLGWQLDSALLENGTDNIPSKKEFISAAKAAIAASDAQYVPMLVRALKASEVNIETDRDGDSYCTECGSYDAINGGEHLRECPFLLRYDALSQLPEDLR